MRTGLARRLLAIGVVCSAAPLAWAQSEAPGSTGESAEREPADARDGALLQRLNEIDDRLGKIEQMRARFRQSRTIPMLRRPMVSSGTLLMRDGAIRWDTLEPAPSTMLVSEGEIRLYYPESAILEIYSTTGGSTGAADAGDLPAQARGGARPRLSQLRDRFTITEIPASSFENAPAGDLLGLELTPIDEPTAAQVRRVRVLIDTAIPMVRRVQITNAEGELTDIELSDLRFDRPISAEQMRLRVPEGTLISRPMEGELDDSGGDGALPGGAGDSP